MADFTLPSGRVVHTHEPTFGQLIHVSSQGADNLEALLHAKFAVIVPDLTREEIEALGRADGFALMEEMARIWDGRPEEAEIPLGDGSTLVSAESSRSLILRPNSGLANIEWQSWRDAWVGRLTNFSQSESSAEHSANGSAGVALMAMPDS